MTSWPPLPGGPQRSFALARHEASGDTSFGHLRGHGNGQFVVSGQRDDLDPHRKALVQPQGDSGGGEFHGIPGSGNGGTETPRQKEVVDLWLEMVGSCFYSCSRCCFNSKSSDSEFCASRCCTPLLLKSWVFKSHGCRDTPISSVRTSQVTTSCFINRRSVMQPHKPHKAAKYFGEISSLWWTSNRKLRPSLQMDVKQLSRTLRRGSSCLRPCPGWAVWIMLDLWLCDRNCEWLSNMIYSILIGTPKR